MSDALIVQKRDKAAAIAAQNAAVAHMTKNKIDW